MKKRVYQYKDFKKLENFDEAFPDSFIRDDNSNDCFIKLLFKVFELGKKVKEQDTITKIIITNISKGFFNVSLELNKKPYNINSKIKEKEIL